MIHPPIITRRRLITGAAALTAYAALEHEAQAAAAFVAKGTINTSSPGGASVTDTSLNITSGANLALIGYVVLTGSSLVSIGTVTMTWNSVSLTQVTSFYNAATTSGIYIFSLANPATGAKNFTINWSGTATQVSFIGVAYSGVNQSTPANNAVTNTASAVNNINVVVTSATGNIATAICSTDVFSSLVTNNTTIFTDVAGAITNEAANYAAGASSVTLNLSGGSTGAWAAVGVNIVAAGASVPTYSTFFAPPAP